MATPTSHPGRFVESNNVEGTEVYSRGGQSIGTIERLMIDKVTGRVAYAVVRFGGFLGIGSDEYAIPWAKLMYDTNLVGYATNITIEQVKASPNFYRVPGYDWSDREAETELYRYWETPPYW